jgi:uncharacterized membrane protein YjjP (DUF1212 family)
LQKLNAKQATELALEVGRILLQSGSATNRVEKMMLKVCAGFGYPNTESFVTPTGIFISLNDTEGDISTSIKRIENRRIDLGKITRVSRLVNCLEEQDCPEGRTNMDARKFREELNQIDVEKTWPTWLLSLCGGATSGFFCLLFGGAWMEFAIAVFIGIVVSYGMKFLSRLSINNFLLNALAAALIVFIAKLLDLYIPYVRLDNIIIGGIMLLVPGLSITNAIRDTMSGDLVSGTARGMEALFITVGVVAGSGSMLKIWALWGF